MADDPIGDFLFGSGDNGGVLKPVGDVANWVAQGISPQTILNNLAGGGGSGGGTPAAATPAADPTAAATDTTGAAPQQAYNPLALQLYFTQNIAPLLASIMDKSNAQSKDFLSMAQEGTKNLHLPDSYRGIFETMLPKQQAAHSDVMSALAGAAVSGPALDSLQKQLQTAATQSTKDYYAQEALRALGTAGSAIPTASEIASAGGTTTKQGG